MSDLDTNRPIKAELIAAKLCAVRNFEHPEVAAEIAAEPRLVEVLLFLQHVSQSANYPGGLARFSLDLIEQSADLIGSLEMRKAGEGKLTEAQMKKIYLALPDSARKALGTFDDGFWGFADFSDTEEWDDSPAREEGSRAERARRERHAAEDRARAARLKALIEKASCAPFVAVCVADARASLASYLRSLCELPHVRFLRPVDAGNHDWNGPQRAPWYFCEVARAIVRFIDRRKAATAATIAETEITRLVFKWLATARKLSRAVLISGNSRFGKTEALRTWCAMNPGTARLVNTPASTSEGDLLREVAKALGLETGPHGSAAVLRDRIDYILTHTGLMLVFDEAHFFFPTSFSRNTAPARMNWVRRNVMDAGLPCAFCATPQSYNSAKKRFVKATGHAIEQFEERLLKTVYLPDRLEDSDLLAVARIHFPGVAEQYLQYVAAKAGATERNFVSDVEKIAELARLNAEEAGRALPTLADIKASIADVLPPLARSEEPPAAFQPAPPAPPRAGRSGRAVQAASRAFSDGLQTACATPAGAGSRITFDTEATEESHVEAGA